MRASRVGEASKWRPAGGPGQGRKWPSLPCLELQEMGEAGASRPRGVYVPGWWGARWGQARALWSRSRLAQALAESHLLLNQEWKPQTCSSL